MSRDKKKGILAEITRFHFSSRDFNGIPLQTLAGNLKLDRTDLIDNLAELIAEERACVLCGDVHKNPHIMALQCQPKETQIAKLETSDSHKCAYPLRRHLETIVDQSQYEGKPYVLSLALGSPQLAHRAFDLSVLEFYRNDPRYSYSNDDIHGHIYVSDEYYDSEKLAPSDRILLQTFGFCYDEDMTRAVAVYVRYLADLSSEHQQIWKARELQGDFRLHPDYYRNTVLAQWGEGVPIFAAFIEELQVINRMARAMERADLFRNDFSDKAKPREFSFLVRPTLKELNDFVLLLDKMISDNINVQFFQNEVPDEVEEVRRNGKVVVKPKGTLTALDEWIRSQFQTDDWEPWSQAIQAFKEVRRRRQKPAHAINDDIFDQSYFHQQRDLMINAYNGVRTLRLLLANHPRASDIEIRPLVREGRIWTY